MKRSHIWRPATDICETEDAFIVQVEIAGMRGADFFVTFDQRQLVIKGSRSDLGTRKAYHQMEIPYGEFTTEAEIPSAIETANIEAVYSDGFLRVVLPKVKPKDIKIGDS